MKPSFSCLSITKCPSLWMIRKNRVYTNSKKGRNSIFPTTLKCVNMWSLKSVHVCILNIFYCYKSLHFLILLFCILFESSVPISLTSMIDIMVLFSCKNRKTVVYESNCSVQVSAKQFWMLCLWIHHWKTFVSSCKFSGCEEKRGNTGSMNTMINEKR